MVGKKSKKLLSKVKPHKPLLLHLQKKAGRGKNGRITIRHQGGGAKQLYRMIDFAQQSFNQKSRVLSLEYDPNRTCFIALVKNEKGEKSYILAPTGLQVGSEVVCLDKAPIIIGNRMRLKNIPVGSFVYNIELEPGRGGIIGRSAGAGAQLMGLEGKYSQLKMPSGEIRKILAECFASIGSLSNAEHRFEKIGKAGRARHMGIRPSVRGSAMNACDHPHGGGKNKQPIGMHPKTPWGKPALGVRTRKSKWTDKLIVERRK